MFGYIAPFRPELKVRDEALFKAYYCGLCKAIGRGCGAVCRLGLTYDLAALAVFADMVQPAPGKLYAGRCALHPTRRRPLVERGEALSYAADLNTLLMAGKLRDDVADGKKSRLPAVWALAPGAKKAAARRPEQYQSIKENLAALSALEKAGCDLPDEAAHPFATLMGEIFCGAVPGEKHSAREAWRFMGYNLGRWVYLLDAWDDLGQDLVSGNYNPLRLSRPGLSQEGEIRESLREEMAFSLTQSLAQASRAFELVAAGRNQALAHNILYDGCAQKMDEILAHPGEKRKREGRKKEDESL